jgi:transposase-like protein
MHENNNTTTPEQSLEIPGSLRDVLGCGLEVKLHLLQHYAELARMLACELLEDEVTALCGERYRREKPFDGRYSRWGSNPGSIKIRQERVPIEIPRVRETEAGREQPLKVYQQMKTSVDIDGAMEEAILLGLSQRDYGRVAGAFVDGFGLSQASVSRSFQERSRKALKAFEQRPLAEEDFVALWIDGKYLAGVQMVICLGLTIDGRKLPLGFVETTTENSEAVKGLFQNLISRGFCFNKGLLCVVDGAKGLFKAVREVFGEYAEVQRCQWHKRENVVSYLPEKDQSTYRRRLQQAYQKSSYEEAKSSLMEILAELERVNRSAANSLMEGMEETLTLHRLGLFEQLGKSLKTTNCIENLNSQLGKYIRRVKRWMDSDQRQRWVAMAMLEIEAKMRRIDHPEHLALLREALHQSIQQKQQTRRQDESFAENNFN